MNYLFDPWDEDERRPHILCSTGIETIGAIMAAVSAAMAVASGVSQHKAQKQQALNAEAAAEQEMLTGKAESARVARINQAKQAEMRAAAGAQGTTLSGSPMEVYLENAKQAALEEADPIYGSNIRAKGLKQSASLYNRAATSSLVSGIGEGVGAVGGLTSTLLKPTATAPKPTTTVIGSGPFKLPGIPQR